MATDFGSDIGGVLDVSADLREVSGRQCLAEAIARRLTTPRGGLFYDLDYGYDLRRLVKAPLVRPAKIEDDIETECLKDPRVLNVDASVSTESSTGDGDDLRVVVSLVDAEGPFKLTILATELTVQLLQEAA
jgi:hypothetical protein